MFNLKSLKNRPTAIIAATSLGVLALALFYALVVWPDQRQKPLNACLTQARTDYENKWLTTCRSLFSPEFLATIDVAKECQTMAALYADPLNAAYEQAMTACQNRYAR